MSECVFFPSPLPYLSELKRREKQAKKDAEKKDKEAKKAATPAAAKPKDKEGEEEALDPTVCFLHTF